MRALRPQCLTLIIKVLRKSGREVKDGKTAKECMNEKQFKVMKATNLFMLKIGSCEGICETCKETCAEYKEWSELCKEELKHANAETNT